MPMTPLHLAAGLPVRKHISLKAFIAVNVLIDLEPITIALFNMDQQGYALHGGFHTLAFATFLALLTCAFKPTRDWIYGALFGAWSHILMDALVHRDVAPFWPVIDDNPLFLDLHLELSILCAIVLSYYLALWVRSLRIGHVRPGR